MMHDFVASYPGISTFMATVKASCRQHGYIETLLGRRRVIAGSNSADRKERARAERQAINSMCQGSAADLIKVRLFCHLPVRLHVLLPYALHAMTQLAMINITCQLTRLSSSTATTTTTAAGAPSDDFHFRRPRSMPGGGLYAAMDEVRLVLQVHDELVFEARNDLVPLVSIYRV